MSFPELARGSLKAHIAPSWWQAHDELLARAVERGDEVLIDFLASRLVTRLRWSELSRRR